MRAMLAKGKTYHRSRRLQTPVAMDFGARLVLSIESEVGVNTQHGTGYVEVGVVRAKDV